MTNSATASDSEVLELVAGKAVRSLEEGQRRVEEGQQRLERVLASIQRDVSSLAGFVSGFQPPASEAGPAPAWAPAAASGAPPDGDALSAESVLPKAEGASRGLSFRELTGISGLFKAASAPDAELPVAAPSKMAPGFQVVDSATAVKQPSLPKHDGDSQEPSAETSRKPSKTKSPTREPSQSSIPDSRLSEVSSDTLGEKRRRGSPTECSRGSGYMFMQELSYRGVSGQWSVRGDALDRQWPWDVEIRCVTGTDHANTAGAVQRAARNRHRPPSKERPVRMSGSIAKVLHQHGARGCRVHPSSTLFAVWTALGAFFLLNDLTITPFVLAWDVDVQSGWLWVMSWVTPVFWSIDVILCFLTCYYTEGRLETRLPQIAKHYLMKWFIPDIVIVACDWVGIALQVASEDGLQGTDAIRALRIGKTVKMLRIAGLVRLTRVLRLGRCGEILQEHWEAKTAGFPVSSQCVWASVCALWLNHVIGCMWFAVGRLADSDTGKHWTDYYMEHRGEILPFMQEGMWFQYVTSLHWSIAQFTLGSIEISCTNSTERWFNIVCLLIGLIFGSTLVSSLSAGMVDYQMRMMEKKNKLQRLRRYLKERKVCQTTSIMVQKQVEQRLKIKERLKEEDVPVITLLSNSLRVELRHEMVKPQLLTMPLYSLMFHMDLPTFQEICMQAVGFAYPHQQDDLFVAGTRTHKAYQLMSGSMEYIQDPHESEFAVEAKVTDIHVGQWLSEASLWSQWTHVGTCKARAASHVLTLDAEECMRITHRVHLLRRLIAEYCQVYHSKVIVARPPTERWCSDLEVPNTSWDVLVPEMGQDAREITSICVVDQLEASFTWLGKHHTLEALRDNILDGESCLIMDSHGQPERLVSAVVAQVYNSESFKLMKVAKADDEHPTPRPCLKLPKLKLHAGESSEDGLRRLLDMLGLHAERMLHSSEDESAPSPEVLVEHKQSSRFGMRSRCTSTIFHLEVDQDPELPPAARQTHSHRLGSTMSSQFGGSRSLKRLSSETLPVDADLSDTKVYHNKDGVKHHLYAWLPDWRVEHFSSAAGKKELSAWVSNFKAADGACDSPSWRGSEASRSNNLANFALL